jgi:hypothetical protein
MTPTETVRLVAEISQIWPSMRLGTHTADTWHPLLADLAYPDALAAVHALGKAQTGYIDPAAVRRQAADTAGLLPPSEGDAFQAVVRVAGDGGRGASALHPAAYDAYRQMGGPTAFDAPPSIVRPQWGRYYAPAAAAHERQLLAGALGTAIETVRRGELEAAPA